MLETDFMPNISSKSVSSDYNRTKRAILGMSLKRKKVLLLILESPRTIEEIAKKMALTHQTSVFSHLRALKDEDLIRGYQQGRNKVYHINEEVLSVIRDGLGNDPDALFEMMQGVIRSEKIVPKRDYRLVQLIRALFIHQNGKAYRDQVEELVSTLYKPGLSDGLRKILTENGMTGFEEKELEDPAFALQTRTQKRGFEGIGHDIHTKKRGHHLRLKPY